MKEQSEDEFWDYYSGLPNPSWYEKVKEVDKPQYDVEAKVYQIIMTSE
jgi:hypothetical protein